MLELLEGIDVLCHSSIVMKKEGKVIYFDPFKIEKDTHDADYIFITHSHYDHFSAEDILKVKRKVKEENGEKTENTKIIITEDLLNEVLKLGFKKEDICIVIPNNSYNFGICFETIPAYNKDKKFHPKGNNWVGYILDIAGNKYYIAGDTDITDENSTVKCDVALVPVGGTYTMNYSEAALLVNKIKPKIGVPTHYGEIVGDKNCGERFKNLLDSDIICKVYIN